MSIHLSIQWSYHNLENLSAKEMYEILQLREKVFIVEQNCAYLDADGLDDIALHIVGRLDGKIIAYTRCFPPHTLKESCVIGRVIVEQAFRKCGLGQILMKRSEEIALQCWREKFTAVPHFSLGAQAHLEYFYQSLGYQRCGDNYDEDGITHLPMHKILHENAIQN